MATTLNPMPSVATGSGGVDTLFSAPWFADGQGFADEVEALAAEQSVSRRSWVPILLVAAVAATGLGMFTTGLGSLAAVLVFVLV